MRRSNLVVILAFGLLTAAAPPAASAAGPDGPQGQCVGPGRPPLDAPSPRRSMGLADDPDHGQIVLFGGWNGTRSLGDTWTWDGTAWTEQHPADAPSPRFGAGMTYDPARGQVVLFGGSDESTGFADTWIWDGTNWIEQHPAHSSWAGENILAYDARTEEVVRIAQWNDPFATWTWDGTDWQEVVRDTFIGRDFAAASSDGNDVLLFGGGKEIFEDIRPMHTTHVWDGDTWLQRKATDKPPRRYQARMAYDAARGQVVLFGGVLELTTYADTWTWDGSNWTRQPGGAGPKPRFWHGMAYDSTRHQVVMFGGTRGSQDCYYGDTWTWDGVTWTEH